VSVFTLNVGQKQECPGQSKELGDAGCGTEAFIRRFRCTERRRTSPERSAKGRTSSSTESSTKPATLRAAPSTSLSEVCLRQDRYHSSRMRFLRFFQNPKKRDFLRFFEV